MGTSDLWVAPDGAVHLLWHDKSCDVRLREKFFPGEKLTISLEYGIVRDGQIVHRQTLAKWEEDGAAKEIPSQARFHMTADGRLLVVTATDLGDGAHENRLQEIRSDRSVSEPIKLDLQHPFPSIFFTATPRGGSSPSDVIDLLGPCVGKTNAISYARIRVT